MARTVSIGAQGFAEIRESGFFLVDKTGLIRDWWNSGDIVTLICRPRRFGKTLNLDMLNCFFSSSYEGRGDLFEGLEVWGDEKIRAEQGSWPVISLSFADIKAQSFENMMDMVTELLADLYRRHLPALENGLDAEEVEYVQRMIAREGSRAENVISIRRLGDMFYRLTGKGTIVLLDEYDTPLQEAWLDGYWDEAVGFFRGLFNSTFKTNVHLKRALITGITRVARESIFSDLNNLKVVTSTSNNYETAFGFTEDEVFAAMDEFGLDDRAGVREWYDGFEFGGVSDIYNPWSITNYLDERILAPYWANSSGNGLVSSLVGAGDAQLKEDFETLLSGEALTEVIDEQISFPDLGYDPNAVWSLMVASGYLKIVAKGIFGIEAGGTTCELSVVNHETMIAFDSMVQRWFARARVSCNGFVSALLADDLEEMNAYMNDVALETFSTFDSGTQPSRTAPERFYHGFVLGLLVDLRGRYRVRSNRESGYGRYDVMLVPVDVQADPGVVIEFKVRNPRKEASLEEAAAAALAQVEERAYAAELVADGVPAEHVHCYGFAFEGKQVLIAGA